MTTPGPLSEILDALNDATVGESVHIDDARKLVVDAYHAGTSAANQSLPADRDGSHGDITWGSGWVERNGHRVYLTNKPEQVFRVLAHRFGSVVPTDLIYRTIWRDRAETVTENTMQVHISRLRSDLKPLGIGVKVQREVGYRLADTRPTAGEGQA